MTLHEAIIAILEQTDEITTSEIATAINSNRSYVRGDGNPLEATQIKRRISKQEYMHLFIIDDGKVYLQH